MTLLQMVSRQPLSFILLSLDLKNVSRGRRFVVVTMIAFASVAKRRVDSGSRHWQNVVAMVLEPGRARGP